MDCTLQNVALEIRTVLDFELSSKAIYVFVAEFIRALLRNTTSTF